MYNDARQLAERGNKVSVVGFVDEEAHLEAASPCPSPAPT
jgi:hypothetical protein